MLNNTDINYAVIFRIGQTIPESKKSQIIMELTDLWK